APSRKTAESQTARAVDDHRAGQLARMLLRRQICLAVSQGVPEEAADVRAQSLSLTHRVTHAADDGAPRYRGEDIVGIDRVGRSGVAGEADRGQVSAESTMQLPMLL